MVEVLNALGYTNIFFVICSIYYLLKFLLSSVNIWLRGYPPSHVNALGELKDNDNDDDEK